MTNNLQKRKSKLNNKKGFSMVELLVAVALIAIIVPVLINGFIHAAKLNYRSRVQQRVDNVATNIYEELANVEYAELQKYFSDNGWTIEQTGVVGTYNATLSSDDVDGEIGNFQVNVTVQEYSKDYIVPDLNLIGVHSAYLTLEDEINEMDSIVENRLIQAIKSDDKVKTAIKNDAASRINETYGTNLNATNIDSSRIVVSCTIDKTKISKQTSVEVGVKNSQFVADYKVSYRYPAAQPNPDGDSSDLGVGYSYSHRLNGKWVSVSNTINVRETLKKVSESEYGNYQFIMEGIDSSVSIKAKGMDAHTMFIYYNPLNKLDWIDIKSNDNTAIHNVYFIEQGVEKDGNGNSVFALKYDNVDSKKSNFKGSFPQVDPHFTQLQQGST
ncbi:MAG: type II secretion system protein, partial [Clostridia bacterium]|nr:type II secretion system protein [Clostridia bacterium]